MNHWTFVIAAYAVTLVGTAALLVGSFVSMRRDEAESEKLRSHDR